MESKEQTDVTMKKSSDDVLECGVRSVVFKYIFLHLNHP